MLDHADHSRKLGAVIPHSLPFSLRVECNANGTLVRTTRSEDDLGALYYVIAVILIYGCSILMMIASYIRKNKEDRHLKRYLKEMAFVRKRELQLSLVSATAKAAAFKRRSGARRQQQQLLLQQRLETEKQRADALLDFESQSALADEARIGEDNDEDDDGDVYDIDKDDISELSRFDCSANLHRASTSSSAFKSCRSTTSSSTFRAPPSFSSLGKNRRGVWAARRQSAVRFSSDCEVVTLSSSSRKSRESVFIPGVWERRSVSSSSSATAPPGVLRRPSTLALDAPPPRSRHVSFSHPRRARSESPAAGRLSFPGAEGLRGELARAPSRGGGASGGVLVSRRGTILGVRPGGGRQTRSWHALEIVTTV